MLRKLSWLAILEPFWQSLSAHLSWVWNTFTVGSSRVPLLHSLCSLHSQTSTPYLLYFECPVTWQWHRSPCPLLCKRLAAAHCLLLQAPVPQSSLCSCSPSHLRWCVYIVSLVQEQATNYLFSIYYTPELKPFQCFYSCPNVPTLLLHAIHTCVHFEISLGLHA